jgi:hypothetical protein
MTLHHRFQGAKYRLFRALMFVATGLSGIAPLFHGLIVFGMSQMMRKALPYTLAKACFLLSGTAFYAVSFPGLHRGEDWPNACGSEDQVPRKSVSWQIWPMGLPCDLSYPGGMRCCGSVDGLSGRLRLCSSKSYLFFSLSYICMPSTESLAAGTCFWARLGTISGWNYFSLDRDEQPHDNVRESWKKCCQRYIFSYQCAPKTVRAKGRWTCFSSISVHRYPALGMALCRQSAMFGME